MAQSEPFLQFQAELLNLPIHRSPQAESTALGAGLLAGIGAGLWSDPKPVIERVMAGGRTFHPTRDQDWRAQVRDRWRHAVSTVVQHYS